MTPATLTPQTSLQRCRYCGKPGASVATLSYWNQVKCLCHPDCKLTGEREEAIDCQTIDADCNDCLYFKRGELVKRWLSGMRDGKATLVLVNMGIVRGYCLKFNRPTEAFPHMSTGRECFQHRLTVRG